MIKVASRFGRTIAYVSVFALLACSAPAKAISDLRESLAKELNRPVPQPRPSILLSAATQKQRQGRAGVNPYAAGQNKWDVVYKGVNLMTGNFSMSATDLTFEGGYGIPVNVTRSYSANNPEEGPLGYGWTLSVDVRSTAGGLMKSSSAPVRSVPVNFKERPSGQFDPNATMADGSNVQPIDAVTATDAAGTEQTIQRDADGILTTPPWDKNKLESEYETKTDQNGNLVQVMVRNYVNTPEGTVYVYEKKGHYVNGARPHDNPSAVPEVSNVLKIAKATDRHGNETKYFYGTTDVQFAKSNGLVAEKPLVRIEMPNGHKIYFDWTGNRVTKVREYVVSGPAREVNYAYTGGNLTAATTPGGKTTSYGIGATVGGLPGAYAGNLITSITDPRGLTTTIHYTGGCFRRPFASTFETSVYAWKIVAPSGNSTFFTGWGYDDQTGVISPPSSLPTNPLQQIGVVVERLGSGSSGGVIGGVMISGNAYAVGDDTFCDIRGFLGSPSDPPNSFDPAAPDWTKTFNLDTLDLVREDRYIKWYAPLSPAQMNNSELYERGRAGLQFWAWNSNKAPNSDIARSTVETSYNFMGQPLQKKAYNQILGFSASPIQKVGYAYWGADKYYQQKAIRDQAGRLSYTDYYDVNAPQGSKGQTYRVYDQKRANIFLDPNAPIPGYSQGNSDAHWRYQIKVADLARRSAGFQYDALGRPTNVEKVRQAATWPYDYTLTSTVYGSNTDGSWGAAGQVTEAASSPDARITQTLAYDSSGRAIRVRDAANREFLTTYDLDGVVQSIHCVDGGLNVPVVSYTYGTSGITNGAVTSVTDHLSGVTQTMTYITGGTAKGQVGSITETGPSGTYSSTYTYNLAGDRDTATYTTQAVHGAASTVKWGYRDYIVAGQPESPSRIFSRLVLLDSSGAETSEQMHYAYDSAGRIRKAFFGLVPQAGWTAYSRTALPAQRVLANYEYDNAGRLKRVAYYQEAYNASLESTGYPFSQQFLRGNECDYEEGFGLNRGLKTASRYLIPVSGQPLNWQTQRQETYSYDANLDYLIGANYGDGLPNQTPSWGYDAGGNRTSDSTVPGAWTYDSLNRIVSSPGKTYTHDVLGNRLTRVDGGSPVTGGHNYTWDILNRMTEYKKGTPGSWTQYTYRADGLRVLKSKHVGGGQLEQTQYRYDGQMGTEDLVTTGPVGAQVIESVTRYGLGARGIDVISRTTSTGTTLAYPIYDAHGNNVGLISRNGANYAVSQERSYDAWGAIRSGIKDTIKLTYCANLGHKEDDESDLIYMRARYYEPGSGRFISEDPGRHDANLYAYASNDPVANVDFNGEITLFDLGMVVDSMRMRAAQASALAAALSRCGDKVAQTAAYHNFRLQLLMMEVMDDVEITFRRVTNGDLSDEISALNMDPSTFQKIMATFRGNDPVTGNDFILRVHWFQQTGGTQVFDVKIKEFLH